MIAKVAVLLLGVVIGTYLGRVSHVPADASEVWGQAGSFESGQTTGAGLDLVAAAAMDVLREYYCDVTSHDRTESGGGTIIAQSPGGRAVRIQYLPGSDAQTEVRVRVSGPKLEMCKDYAHMILKDMLFLPRWPVALAGK